MRNETAKEATEKTKIENALNLLKLGKLSFDEIADAMKLLSEDIELRKQLSAGALKKAEELNIETRVKKIRDFLEIVVQNDPVLASND